MADWRELAEAIRRRKKSTSYAELADLLKAAGFRHARSKGSHRIFTKPGCFKNVSLKDEPGHVKIGHVTTTLNAVEECGDE